MSISRREFLKFCITSGAALGLSVDVVGKLQKSLLAGGTDLPTVIWLNAANCTGCTVSLANRIAAEPPTDVADLLINTVNLAFHLNLMGAAGDLAVQSLQAASQGSFILAVEGGIPTAFGGHTCMLWTEQDNGTPGCVGPASAKEVTALEAVRSLAPKAAARLAIGTCASFGGIPAGSPNPTGVRSLRAATGLASINIPGCPPHPDWMVWTIAQLLAGVTPQLDSFGRPFALFGSESRNVHEQCPRREREEADTFGVEGFCLEELGCKGPRTQGDCPTRMWNNRTSYCMEANSLCIGCTEKGFPDGFSPFYGEGGDD